MYTYTWLNRFKKATKSNAFNLMKKNKINGIKTAKRLLWILHKKFEIMIRAKPGNKVCS